MSFTSRKAVTDVGRFGCKRIPSRKRSYAVAPTESDHVSWIAGRADACTSAREQMATADSVKELGGLASVQILVGITTVTAVEFVAPASLSDRTK
jgi:hypothetical protein